MKTTLDHRGDRFTLASVTGAVILAVLVGCAALGWAVGHWVNRELEVQRQAEYESLYNFRLEQLTGLLRAKTTTLVSVAAFLPRLQELDQQQFSDVVQPITRSAVTDFVCWHDLNTSALLSHPPDTAGCNEFVLFRTTIPLAGNSTALLLSSAAGDTTTTRSGFVSIKLDLGEIRSSPGDNPYTEYLYISDRNALTLDRFLITPDGLVSSPDITADTSSDQQRIANVLNFGDIELIYDIHYKPILSLLPWLSALVTLLTALLMSSIVVFFWWKNGVLGQQIRLRTEELEQFAYRAAHDLKSPLTGIRQLAAFAREDLGYADYPAVQANVARIEKQALSLETMLSGLYDLTMDSSGVRHARPFDVYAVVENILLRHAAAIAQSGIEVTWSRTTPCITKLPQARIEQILDNLISNAIKYANTSNERTRTIQVIAEQQRDGLQLTVADNGVGIPDDFFQRPGIQLFKRYRPDLAVGSGVGLSITTRHVFHLKGTISFEQCQPGTRVIVRIPSPTDDSDENHSGNR